MEESNLRDVLFLIKSTSLRLVVASRELPLDRVIAADEIGFITVERPISSHG